MAIITVTREDLYGQVWSEPMSRLASSYGLSDAGLATICRKHDIPCPPRGYWAKKAAGQTPAQTPLPNSDGDSPIRIRESYGSSNSPSLNNDMWELVGKEKDVDLRIELRDHLRGAHRLVGEAFQELRGSSVDAEGLFILPENSPLDLRVSKPVLRRSLFLMDALLRALENRGDPVSPGPCVTLLDVCVRFGISEILETIREEAEPEDLSGRYEFGHNRFRSKRVPSGRLTVRIHDAQRYWLRGCRHTWRDTLKQPLEQRLEAVIGGLIQFAARVRQNREERQREEEARAAAELRRQEESRQRAAKRAAILAERKRLDDLVEDSQCWRRSRILRDYIEEARRAYLARHGAVEAGSEMAEWLEWASRHADWLDPLTDSPPSLLDEEVGDDSNDGTAFRQRG